MSLSSRCTGPRFGPTRSNRSQALIPCVSRYVRSFLVLGLIVLWPRYVSAQSGRVVLIGIDETLAAAVGVALEPWGSELVRRSGVAPASMPGASEVGRAIASEETALAVVWISLTEDGAALWVYDADADRTLARGLLSPPPYDDATAAAIALTLKTLLRHSTVAPLAERAVVPEPAPPPHPPPPPPPPPPRPPPPEPHGRLVRLELAVGALGLATDVVDAVEPRIALALGFFPAELDGVLGVALRVRTGPGIGFEADATRGRFTDTWIAAEIRLRGHVDRVSLGGGLAGGTVLSTLDASLAPDVAASRVAAAALGVLDLEAGVRVDASLAFHLRGGVGLVGPADRFVVREQPVLVVSPISAFGELALEYSFP